MSLIQSIQTAQAKAREKKEQAPHRINALIQRYNRGDVENREALAYALQAKTWLDLINLFHESAKTVNEVIQALKNNTITEEDAIKIVWNALVAVHCTEFVEIE